MITADLQAHGRTADTDRPLRHELLADDIAGSSGTSGCRGGRHGVLVRGGGCASHRRSASCLVRRLVITSFPCRRDGWFAESLAGMDQMGSQLAGMLMRSRCTSPTPRSPPGSRTSACCWTRRASCCAGTTTGPRTSPRSPRRSCWFSRTPTRCARPTSWISTRARRRAAGRDLGRFAAPGGPAGRAAGPDALRHLPLPRPARRGQCVPRGRVAGAARADRL